MNRRSPAAFLNEDRFADAEVPDSARPRAEPQWETVAENGRYGWHDHRIHWMSQTPPQPVREDESRRVKIFDWSVPMTVGRPSGGGAGLAHLARARRGWAATGRGARVRRGGDRGRAARRCSSAAAAGARAAETRRRPGETASVLAIAGLACVLALALPATAGAHAVLVDSEPSRGDAVERAPARVVFRFSEPVEIAFGAVRVFDARGERVDSGGAAASRRRRARRQRGRRAPGCRTAATRPPTA